MELLTATQAAKRLKTSTQEIELLRSSGELAPATMRPCQSFPNQTVRVYAPADLDLLKSRVKRHLKYIKVCPNRRFGVELEGFGISYDEIEGGLDDVFGHTHQDGESKWWVGEDGSIEGEFPFEVKSPPISGEPGLYEVHSVCTMLESMGGEVNSSCGLHIHHETRDISSEFRRRVFHLYGRAERQLDRLMPWSRRENRSGFARTMSGPTYNTYWERGDRCHKVNLFSFERHGTVEFRHHGGTLNPEKVNNWIVVTQKILQRAFSEEPLVENGKPYTWTQMLSVLGIADAVESGEEWASDITVFLADRRDVMDKRAKREEGRRKRRRSEAERRTRQHRRELEARMTEQVAEQVWPTGAPEQRSADEAMFIEGPNDEEIMRAARADIPISVRGWAVGCDCSDCHDAVALYLSGEYNEPFDNVRSDDFDTLLEQAEARIVWRVWNPA